MPTIQVIHHYDVVHLLTVELAKPAPDDFYPTYQSGMVHTEQELSDISYYQALAEAQGLTTNDYFG